MPSPSISTVLPAATPRNTMRATCSQASQHLGTPLSSLSLEGHAAIRARPKTPQAGKPGFFSLSQAA
jgi:hypothetical protein